MPIGKRVFGPPLDPFNSAKPSLVRFQKNFYKYGMVNTSLKKLKGHLLALIRLSRKETATAILSSKMTMRPWGLDFFVEVESKNEVCLLCEVNQKQIPAFDFICASLESISAIEDTLGKVRDCQHGFYTTEGEVNILRMLKLGSVTPRQGRNARHNENGYHHNTMASI
ncbi:hypothetical protein Tco_0536077 [Tanacetum coccineum]